jgi:hypothetical protein
MASWQNDKLANWQVGKMASWQNGKLAKWQVGEMAFLNRKYLKMIVYETASW